MSVHSLLSQTSWKKQERSKVDRMLRIFIHSRHNLDPWKLAREYSDGYAQSPFPYGMTVPDSRGRTVEYSSDGMFSKLQQLGWDLFGFDLLHALRNLRKARRSDIIWTVLEWEWLPISLLQRLRLIQKKPIIANSVWMM